MATIHEECVTVRFSILARNDEAVKKNFVSDEQIDIIDATLQEVLGDNTGIVVEVERSKG